MTENNALLEIKDLSVNFHTLDGIVNAVHKINLTINRGECVGIVGESGPGKSQTFLAAMGLLAKNSKTLGESLYKGKDLLRMPLDQLNYYRGSKISMIFQDPLTSLAPHIKIGEQMIEVLKYHKNMNKAEATKLAIKWLGKVRIPEAQRRFSQYPHELSGGMRQRVMIAMAMLCEPELLIADEPTTALDVSVQSEILDLMEELKRSHNLAIVLITHDMGVVARMRDRIAVMRFGTYVETGSADEIFYHPQNDYTKMLINAMPRIDDPNCEDHQQVPRYEESSQHADTSSLEVNKVSFNLRLGETLGVVGESGCGKSALARAVLRLIKAKGGTACWFGKDIMEFDAKEMLKLRKDFQIVFQDPLASLNPR